MPTIKKIENCRICRSRKLSTFLSLKPMPKPNGFLVKPISERRYPLNVQRCHVCGNIQLQHVIDASELFSNYLYMSSMSKTMFKHFSATAKYLVKRFNLTSKSLVVDIGSNDGTFLSTFSGSKVKTLGIDPAKNLKLIASKVGVETHTAFFGIKSAVEVVNRYGHADVITGINVFAHIDNLEGVFQGVNVLLKDKGVLMMEFPYLVDLIQKNEFDTIYHEHLSYFLAKPLEVILARNGFEIFDFQRFSTHGGTIRFFIQRISERPYPVLSKVNNLYKYEHDIGMYDDKTYSRFAKNIQDIPIGLVSIVTKLKKQGKRVIGYGASAKGNVLLNMCGFGPKDIEYIVDSTPYKQGLYTPGSHIPIKSEEYLEQDNPDYAILFIWNFKDEVVNKQKDKFLKRGGRFVIPVPKVEIL